MICVQRFSTAKGGSEGRQQHRYCGTEAIASRPVASLALMCTVVMQCVQWFGEMVRYTLRRENANILARQGETPPAMQWRHTSSRAN